MKKKVFITGISGFVGSNLKTYLGQGFDITGIARDASAQNISYADFFAKEQRYDAFVHLAGKAHDLKKTSAEQEYFEVNFELTKKVYDAFLASDARTFVYVSSVKAAKDVVDGVLTEDASCDPVTAYGKSKRMAEEYILAHLPSGRNVYLLRPCMIHGPGNKGNLNLLYGVVSKGIPYPLAAFENQRSFLSVGNLCYAIENLITRDIPSGIYNVSDDETLSTNDIIALISESLGKKPKLWRIPKFAIALLAKTGSVLRLPLNSERLGKLTENYVVSNNKLTAAVGEFPLGARQGLIATFESFKNNKH